ncbi:MerR family transcriptional regulator [Paenibacillus sp.]|uniref:MerR family transcriptional regulator n=1 Tax=Paenibacillus sp. TaxID=58172 RepID=UPI002D6DFDBA|nr:MerR family transcriptional regulator [Paenibacillus sp.]HZG57413.1 MerR family transcriptional regulator [Paenibacillus sp.]
MLSIGDIARRTGVATSAIRYYEQAGLLPPPERSNGRRRYSEETIERIEVVKLAQQAGFQLHEIGVLLNGFDANAAPSERWRELAKKKCEELETKARQLRAMQDLLSTAARCECLTWDECRRVLATADGGSETEART